MLPAETHGMKQPYTQRSPVASGAADAVRSTLLTASRDRIRPALEGVLTLAVAERKNCEAIAPQPFPFPSRQYSRACPTEGFSERTVGTPFWKPLWSNAGWLVR